MPRADDDRIYTIISLAQVRTDPAPQRIIHCHLQDAS